MCSCSFFLTNWYLFLLLYILQILSLFQSYNFFTPHHVHSFYEFIPLLLFKMVPSVSLSYSLILSLSLSNSRNTFTRVTAQAQASKSLRYYTHRVIMTYLIKNIKPTKTNDKLAAEIRHTHTFCHSQNGPV